MDDSEQLALAVPMKPILENSENQKQTSQFLMREMATMKNKQENLEKVCTLLLKQNQKMLHENKLLWSHIIQEK